MKTNVKIKDEVRLTGEGAVAARINNEQELRRSVMAHFLWEDNFYENGESVTERIESLVPTVDPYKVGSIAYEARTLMNLRHVPLFLVNEMSKYDTHKGLVAELLEQVIQRPDELTEFMAIYMKGARHPISAQVKKGLARAYRKFDEYQLAKYNRKEMWKLRDILRIAHPKPYDSQTAALWGKLLKDELATPDTWEVALSAGLNKKDAFTRLINENKLGALALLRNLRNMSQAGVDKALVIAALDRMKTDRVLPFRFVAAAKAAPEYEDAIDRAFLRAVSQDQIPGRTLVVVDVSGSMWGGMLSAKSDMTRVDAAASLGAIAREMFSDVAVYATAGNDGTRQHKTALVPNRHGMALVDAIQKDMYNALGGGGIFLTPVCRWLAEREKDVQRMIVITDEQDCAVADRDKPTIAEPLGSKANYLLNVSAERNGIGYGKWTHIDGFSENVFNYIRNIER